MYRNACASALRKSFDTTRWKVNSSRKFSLVSVHSSFPTTLHRFQAQRPSNLGDFAKQEGNSFDAGIIVSEDGLVYPRVTPKIPFSNGAVFMPNTFTMQEFARTAFDEHADDVENGISQTSSVICSLPKGASIPDSLVLFREYSSRFSLQPSGPMSLKDLNSLLDEFYSKYGTFTDAETWFDKYEYHAAADDDIVGDWWL